MLDFKYPDIFMGLSLPPSGRLTSRSLGSGFSPEDTFSTTSCELGPEEERSWLYYLAEISLRRIMNRILEGFYVRQEEWRAYSFAEMLLHYKTFSQELILWYDLIHTKFNLTNADVPQAPAHSSSVTIRRRNYA